MDQEPSQNQLSFIHCPFAHDFIPTGQNPSRILLVVFVERNVSLINEFDVYMSLVYFLSLFLFRYSFFYYLLSNCFAEFCYFKSLSYGLLVMSGIVVEYFYSCEANILELSVIFWPLHFP
jgi:hypothetical protein